MVAHAQPRHHLRRQDPDSAPSISGIAGGVSTANQVAPTGGLALDSSVLSTATQSAPNLGVTTTPETTLPPATTQTTSSSSSSTPSPSAAAASSSPISLSTVVGACVGAFIGVAALILLALWFYRRYSKSLKQHARSRRAMVAARNMKAEQGRRRSHLEPWNKLEEGDDKWEGMYQTKEVDSVAPMEKLTMFKKSPSVRTAFTHTNSPDEPITLGSHPFAQYHPNLAEELAIGETDKLGELPIARQFLGRVETAPAISWDGSTVREESYIDGRSTPNKAAAYPTPAATKSHSHYWESAEVQYHDPEPEPVSATSARSRNPFDGDANLQRRSTSNPFFSGGSDSTPRRRSNSTRSRSGSMHSRSNSTGTVKPDLEEPPIPKIDKGKGRAIEPFDDEDPFTDGKIPSFPRPFITHNHNPSGSLSSISSNDRALQSLIAALDVSAEEAQERLRVASMQPSIVSGVSVYTSGGEEEDVTGSFPLPPSGAKK
ncbi:hypothetical protein H0H93_012647 [Arthromyces matolae]|nr:hypothetical protein H0H93_012647 [Arthromyces matolae]